MKKTFRLGIPRVASVFLINRVNDLKFTVSFETVVRKVMAIIMTKTNKDFQYNENSICSSLGDRQWIGSLLTQFNLILSLGDGCN
jgi:hypothetical protein